MIFGPWTMMDTEPSGGHLSETGMKYFYGRTSIGEGRSFASCIYICSANESGPWGLLRYGESYRGGLILTVCPEFYGITLRLYDPQVIMSRIDAVLLQYGHVLCADAAEAEKAAMLA